MQYEEKKLKAEETAFKKKLGKKIKKHRKQAGLSQLKLALISNISRTQISRLENGEISTSVLTLLRVAKALQLDKEQLLDLLE
ncbi:helix-turn-helix domain-containing protein [Flagellimonas sp.]|uniref:helix-turn-helix domain-containing protein n=1 Tax=Flagellimonas sp. TaxID=2058762 RepID=UPI003F4A18E8